MHCKRRPALLLTTIVACVHTPLLHPKQGTCLAWGSRPRMQKDCIAVQYPRHAKCSCIQSSRFRIRRGELSSHAFSLVNRLQHRIPQAICSSRRGIPLAQSPNPHAQVGPHGTASSALSILILSWPSLRLQPLHDDESYGSNDCQRQDVNFGNASGYAPRRAKLSGLLAVSRTLFSPTDRVWMETMVVASRAANGFLCLHTSFSHLDTIMTIPASCHVSSRHLPSSRQTKLPQVATFQHLNRSVTHLSADGCFKFSVAQSRYAE